MFGATLSARLENNNIVVSTWATTAPALFEKPTITGSWTPIVTNIDGVNNKYEYRVAATNSARFFGR
jgi:hypothetical protein